MNPHFCFIVYQPNVINIDELVKQFEDTPKDYGATMVVMYFVANHNKGTLPLYILGSWMQQPLRIDEIENLKALASNKIIIPRKVGEAK